MLLQRYPFGNRWNGRIGGRWASVSFWQACMNRFFRPRISLAVTTQPCGELR